MRIVAHPAMHALGLAAMMVAAAPAAAAEYIVSLSSTSSTAAGNGTTYNTFDRGPLEIVRGVSSTAPTTTYESGSSGAFGWAETGAVHARALASGATGIPSCFFCGSGTGQSSAYVESSDVVFANAAGFAAGTEALVTTRVSLTGSSGVTGSGNFWSGQSSWRATGRVNNDFFEKSGTFSSDGVNGITQDYGDTINPFTQTFKIILGQNNLIMLRGETWAYANSGGFGVNTVAADSNLGNTISWGGIEKMTIGGVEITDFSAISPDTGFDFRRGYLAATGAVPEPGTWAMMLVGFAAVGLSLRRRRRPLKALA